MLVWLCLWGRTNVLVHTTIVDHKCTIPPPYRPWLRSWEIASYWLFCESVMGQSITALGNSHLEVDHKNSQSHLWVDGDRPPGRAVPIDSQMALAIFCDWDRCDYIVPCTQLSITNGFGFGYSQTVILWLSQSIRVGDPSLCAFVCKEINGVLHFAVQAKLECGNHDIIEFAPTVAPSGLSKALSQSGLAVPVGIKSAGTSPTVKFSKSSETTCSNSSQKWTYGSFK